HPRELHSLAAEKSILCAILLDNSAVAKVAGLRTGHFYDKVCGYIYQAMVELHSSGSPIDPVTIEAKLTADGIKSINLSNISELVTACGVPSNIQSYIDIVMGFHREREFRLNLYSALHNAAGTEDLTSRVKTILDSGP